MSEFNTEDYLNGMDDADSLTDNSTDEIGETVPEESTQNTDTSQSASEELESEVAQSENDEQNSEEEDSLTPLGKAKAEAAEYLDALQRERAAFVNFRNRAAKDQERYREYGVVDVLTALLPALDDIDRIRANSKMDESFDAVAAKIDKTFEKFGVEKFGEEGEDFDPTRHEGILRKPDTQVSQEVVDTVVEAGYKIGDRVIRAARVVVAVPQE